MSRTWFGGRRRDCPLIFCAARVTLSTSFDMAKSSTLVVMKLGVIIGVLLVSAVAGADEDYEGQLDRSRAHPAPLAGLERAHVGPPRWCGRMKERDESWAGSIANSMQEYRGGHYQQSSLVRSAQLVCNAPNRPAAQHAAAEILQYWINETGLSEADAIASLAARFDGDAFEASHDQLCQQLGDGDSDDDDTGYDTDLSERVAKVHRSGEHGHGHSHGHAKPSRPGGKKLDTARKELLGCNGDPLWLRLSPNADELAPYVDRGPVEQDTLARAAWILNGAKKALDPAERPERVLVRYVVDQFTLHSVTTDQLMRVLDAAPYKGNVYARAVVLETSGAIKLWAARYEAAVAAKIGDPAWKELLVTAPQRGAAAWHAAADKYKDALAHSDAFAENLDEGCKKQLWADFVPIVKKLKHDNVRVLRQSISDDPIVGVLLDRLMNCLVVEGEEAPAQTLGHLVEEVRVMVGPQMAAYYASIDALDKLDKLHVKPSDLPYPATPLEHDDGEVDGVGSEEGVIASVTKSKIGLHIAFVQSRVQTMSQKCVETNRVDRVRPDGKLIYRQECHDTGLVWSDTTPRPLDVRVPYGAGLQAGRYAKFDDEDASDVIPITVFSDKVGKHLIAFAGVPLE
jgi:hypothetical protein